MPKQPEDFPALGPMETAAATYRERRTTYGASEQRYADIMMALFPDGVTLRTHSDHVRYGIFTQMVSKLARYTQDFMVGHLDSVHDLGVYAFMLEAEDRRP